MIDSLGKEIFSLIQKLYPICRSITGDGVRESLKIIKEHVNLEIFEVPSGTKAFDWIVPKEWNIRDAYVKNSKGEKIIDFGKSNLHVLNYSIPVHKHVNLSELKQHLYSLPDYPELIPYLTSYYNENWGFCITHNQLKELEEDTYEVLIDSTLTEGSLTYGELFIPGRKNEEVLLSTYICHPSLCNDNLTGPAVLTYLAKHLSNMTLEYSYRFIFIPETIGSITWLSKNEDKVDNIKYGLIATCLGDNGKFTYKKTRTGNADIDKIVAKVLKDSLHEFEIIDYSPLGSDERQFCSPGFNLPIGRLTKTPIAMFDQYHTSGDNLQYINQISLQHSIEQYLEVIYLIENNKKCINLNPKCEPQLGKRGIYAAIGGQKSSREDSVAMLWILNLSDGENSLLDIANKSNINFRIIKNISDVLIEHNLLKVIDSI